LHPPLFVIREGTSNKAPKLLGVVKLSEMAQLVDDHVIRKFWWKLDQTPIEVQIALL
jgi:hypothetical protein